MSDEVEALTEYLVRECQWCEEDAHHRIDAAMIMARWPEIGKLPRQLDSARAWAAHWQQEADQADKIRRDTAREAIGVAKDNDQLRGQVALLSWLHAEAQWKLSRSMPVQPPSVNQSVTVDTDPKIKAWRAS